ncbi:hypothetical protein Ssi02_30110 [Sinosporangium siamense]|uniref:Tyrosinase copper-binding domain-containing protein n=2 Tax=Sinosporangium siamense TaxID=1367973 RepID=A0A919RHA1_9ACTN|nr:hypothetical protein Ssi02_30110 [Sinosporangium siamense]
MVEPGRRGLFRMVAGGAAALGASAFDVPASASPHIWAEISPVPTGCSSETYQGRQVQICPEAPVVDGVVARGVFIDGVPLLVVVRHGQFTSALNAHARHGELRAAAHDAVNLLGGAALELRRCRLDPPRHLAPPPEARGRPARRNVATLTARERADFVDALLTLKSEGVYDYLVDLYRRAFSNPWNVHTHTASLPWHRAFLLLLESQIQRIAPASALPYWEGDTRRSRGEAPFSADLLGGDGYTGDDAGTSGRPRPAEVVTGPFAARTGQWPITVREDNRGYLRREMGRAASGTGSRWGGRNTSLGQAHSWVGGTMSSASSPNDPIFFLHRCNVDRLWAQRRHPALADVLSAEVLDTPLEPFHQELNWTITPRQLLKHRRHRAYA